MQRMHYYITLITINLLYSILIQAIIKMGGVTNQNEKAVAHWRKKLSGAQKNYTTTMEKELLAITEILKEFQNMLYGHR